MTVENAELKKVVETFHQFDPVGVTGVFVLQESHISIHTWPEKNFAAIDIYTAAKKATQKKHAIFYAI